MTLNDGNLLVAIGRSPVKGIVTAVHLPDRKLSVDIRYSGTNPLVWVPFGLNAIDYHVTVLIDFGATGGPTAKVSGDHDAFPNYEIYINRERVHQWEHGENTIRELLPPNDDVVFDDSPQQIEP